MNGGVKVKKAIWKGYSLYGAISPCGIFFFFAGNSPCGISLSKKTSVLVVYMHGYGKYTLKSNQFTKNCVSQLVQLSLELVGRQGFRLNFHARAGKCMLHALFNLSGSYLPHIPWLFGSQDFQQRLVSSWLPTRSRKRENRIDDIYSLVLEEYSPLDLGLILFFGLTVTEWLKQINMIVISLVTGGWVLKHASDQLIHTYEI